MSRPRTIVISGAASGLGAATATRLRAADARVIGIDRHAFADVTVEADLGTPDGRRHAVEASLAAADGPIDGVVSCAGLGPYDEPAAITPVNYFGAVALLDGLRGALADGDAPAAVAIASIGAIFAEDTAPEHVQACLAGDEPAACAAVEGRDGTTVYSSCKRALALAVRRRCADWGAQGIRLNTVAPGKMETPMLDKLLAHPDHAPAIGALPVALGRSGPAAEIAGAVVFLLGPDASYVHGQTLFVDGGSEALVRPDLI